MSVIGSEIASSVYGHLLLRWVEERREGEALVKLSSFVLHDLKNCVSAIQGAVEGARAHMDEPEFRRDLLISLSAAGQRMMGLMDRLSEVRASPRPSLHRDEPCRVEGILSDAVRHSGVESSPV